MNSLIKTISSGWHPLRVVYLILGVMMMAQALQGRDIPFALIGGLFLYQSIFNTGCCGMSGGFWANDKESAQKKLEDTEYTEIK